MADEQDPEMIRRQMEAQRAALADKLETLENKIVQTVEGAREAVAETVQTVKETVQSSVETVKESVTSSVETVKETFDLPRQVQRHPWPMFGGAVAFGFAAGWLLNRAVGGTGGGRSSESWTYASRPTTLPPSPPPPAPSSGEAWAQSLAQTFSPELHKLKGLAVGAALSVVRDLVSQAVPDKLRPQVSELMDNVTTKLGGDPVAGELVGSLWGHHHNGRSTPDEL
jgi:ElaB/YqjD/DUF883 family membrane-anchored ribosome-binding protein